MEYNKFSSDELKYVLESLQNYTGHIIRDVPQYSAIASTKVKMGINLIERVKLHIDSTPLEIKERCTTEEIDIK